MNNDLTYRKASKEDVKEILQIVSNVFDQFVAPNYTEEGNQEFYKYLDANALEKRLENNHFILVCESEGKIVGVIEMRKNNHVSLLFVLPEFQGRNIAKTLFTRALEISKHAEPELHEISVNSSPNAVVIYERLGFTKTSPEQLKNGIRFTPMIYRIK